MMIGLWSEVIAFNLDRTRGLGRHFPDSSTA